MQILDGQVEQNRQRAGGKLNIIPPKAAKLPAACWLILAGLFDMGVSPPKAFKNINSTKGSTEIKLMFDTLVQMGLKPLFLVH